MYKLMLESIVFIKQFFINSNNELHKTQQNSLRKTYKVLNFSKVSGFSTRTMPLFLLTVSMNFCMIFLIVGPKPDKQTSGIIFQLRNLIDINSTKLNLNLLNLLLSCQTFFFKRRQNGKGYFHQLNTLIIAEEKTFVLKITAIFTKCGCSSFSRGFFLYQRTIDEYYNLQ